MSRRLFALIPLLVLIAAAWPAAADRSEVETRIRRVENGLLPRMVPKGEAGRGHSLPERMKHHRVPGVSIAVINDGKVEWARAYGVVEEGSETPVTTRTLFQAGSISKAVSALGTMRLVQRGKLALDEDVNAKLTTWKVPENDFTKEQKVTLRRIMSHTAGLTVHGFPGYEAGQPVPTLVQVLKGEKPANTPSVRVDILPGSQFRYSGGGTTVMQQLVIDAAGKPFPRYMEDSVLGPLSMRDSTFDQPLPDRMSSRAACGHPAPGTKVPGRFHTYPEMAAAGLWTTPSDLARFAVAIQGAAVGQKGAILSSTLAREMLTPVKETAALGFFLSGSGEGLLFKHDGRDAGFDADLRAYVKGGKGAVIMINANNNAGFVAEVVRGIAREYGWPGYPLDQREFVRLAPERLAPYAGRYQAADPGFILSVSREGERLFAQTTGEVRGARAELFAETEDRFYVPAANVTITFKRNDKGAVTEALINRGGRETAARRLAGWPE